MIMFRFSRTRSRYDPASWRNASGIESAVIKHVLDHVVHSSTVGRVESAGCLAGLVTLCSGIDCIQTKKMTDTAHGNNKDGFSSFAAAAVSLNHFAPSSRSVAD